MIFYSELKRKNSFESEAEYRDFLSLWRDKKMHTLKDLLTYYVKKDTEPAVNAIENLQEFYLKKNISIFKDAVTLPGVAKILMFKDVKQPVLVFSNEERDIYHIIKKGIVGGPSIIFTREAICDVTPIRNNPEEITRSIKGYDLNLLYPSALIEPVPIGQYVIRRAENDFKPVYREFFLDTYAWMDMLSDTQNISIQHRMNGHKDVTVFNFRAHGHDPENNAVFFFYNCYNNGCNKCTAANNLSLKVRNMKYNKTLFIQKLFSEIYEVLVIWECEYKNVFKSMCYKYVHRYLPLFTRENPNKVSQECLVQSVFRKEVQGFMEIDIQVPQNWSDEGVMCKPSTDLPPKIYFQDMPPIFQNSILKFCDFPSDMQQFIEKNSLPKNDRKLLLSAYSCKRGTFHTDLIR